MFNTWSLFKDFNNALVLLKQLWCLCWSQPWVTALVSTGMPRLACWDYPWDWNLFILFVLWLQVSALSFILYPNHFFLFRQSLGVKLLQSYPRLEEFLETPAGKPHERNKFPPDWLTIIIYRKVPSWYLHGILFMASYSNATLIVKKKNNLQSWK